MTEINGTEMEKCTALEPCATTFHAPEKPKGGTSSCEFSDPAFYNNKSQHIHRWAPWIAGFSKDFVRDSIGRFIPCGGVVLDPFAGVGTTLVESMLTGNDSFGFEINPYAHFVSETKTRAVFVDVEAFGKEIRRFEAFFASCAASDYEAKSTVPEGFRSKVEFYSPNVLKKVLALHDFICQIEQGDVTAMFRLAFSSTMVRYSNYSYEPSLGTRKGSGKEDISDFDVGGLTVMKLKECLEDIEWAQKEMGGKPIPRSEVIHDSFFNYASHIEEGSIDLIVTSPPYLNNYHYNRNTRPQMYWLGFVSSPAEMKGLEESNFGTYWQTARDKDRVDLAFKPECSDIEERLDEIRSMNPEKGTYGGKGWANYAASYFNDCYRLSQGIGHSLRSGSTALVVIGNSIVQGVHVPTDAYFAQIADLVGLETVRIHVPRETRVGNSIKDSGLRSKSKEKKNLYEAIVEVRKK
ncbi:MAG: site-specific DNA-methyltransferase [Candidatus Methanoplasma sp.]|jgi:hypothetical protein|nr:site-specific DNA-methyltransferase [Candidatus Methanoplasma sp.]